MVSCRVEEPRTVLERTITSLLETDAALAACSTSDRLSAISSVGPGELRRSRQDIAVRYHGSDEQEELGLIVLLDSLGYRPAEHHSDQCRDQEEYPPTSNDRDRSDHLIGHIEGCGWNAHERHRAGGNMCSILPVPSTETHVRRPRPQLCIVTISAADRGC